MSTAWSMIFVDVVAVLVLTTGCFLLAGLAGDGWIRIVVYQAIGGVGLTFGVALPLRYFLVEQRRQSERREAILSYEARRREFEARLGRALDMCESDAAVLSVTGRALDDLAPNALVEILLADSSQAHLVKVVDSPAPATALSGCSVATPHGCPAVRNGHALRFDDSDQLDVCPHLVGRAHGRSGAVCVPVGVMGSIVGVVHAVHEITTTLETHTAEGLDVLAHQFGVRVGVLAAMAQSQIHANTDPLTGLLNRRSLESEAHQMMRPGATTAVVYVDLDHFKALNDAHGHDMGDRALRLFARTLLRAMPTPALVARYGGEEFVVVLPDTDASSAVRIFDGLRHDLEVALADGRVPRFTVSAGVTDNSDNDTATLDELIGAADGWLLQAKSSGRDRVMWVGPAHNVVSLTPAHTAR